MGKLLTDRRTPHELAASRQVIELADKIGGFERLCEVVSSDLQTLAARSRPANWRDARVTGRLEFGFADDREDLPVLVGDVQTTVYAVCQRCLEPMRLALKAELKLLLADEKLDGYEAWELDENTLRPLDIVDEALVMALPLSALHADSERCKPAAAAKDVAEEKTRPFAALRAQMDESD